MWKFIQILRSLGTLFFLIKRQDREDYIDAGLDWVEEKYEDNPSVQNVCKGIRALLGVEDGDEKEEQSITELVDGVLDGIEDNFADDPSAQKVCKLLREVLNVPDNDEEESEENASSAAMQSRAGGSGQQRRP